MSRKTAISIIAIILALVLVISVILAYKKRDEKARKDEWPTITTEQSTKTYRNENDGYEIKYPEDWEVELVHKSSISVNNPNKQDERVYIVRQRNIPHPAMSESLTEDIIVDGISAKLYHDVDEATGTKNIDKAIFDIPGSEDDFYIAGYGNTFDLILSSFRLIR